MNQITTPKQAVDYANMVATPAGLQLGITIHLDKYCRPLPFGIAQTQPSHSVIMVKSRDGECLPSPRLIEEVYHARLLWAKQGKSVTDVIIIGEDGFFSFSEEKTFNL